MPEGAKGKAEQSGRAGVVRERQGRGGDEEARRDGPLLN